MGDNLSYCGLTCEISCTIYLATKEEDLEKKHKMKVDIVRYIKEHYGQETKPEDFTCDGCKTENGSLFSECRDCRIRKFAQQKEVENCAHCDEYACQASGIFHRGPTSQGTIRRGKKPTRSCIQ